ncbi:phosphonate ABC transporter ATP-binding protein [Siculibacillus lacustris]|uniref:Phosphonate ABC transporter ATP-binding protein n=1 Tax=Siculibacillus lacustris TaxID=1549641 RepID=A0A4Q9VPC9_9HYPH|nr:phosphonate ABC transporter ATP-binding protein [Siculibacillus lacustris]TBW37585.1 phosphonate ABC transporter ATP-binding protein [Siculibacillus lacustris]
MLAIEALTRRFGDFTAVDRVDLTIPTGQMVAVIGRSGAGKSTLLRMIDRLIEPSEGRIRFEDRDITALKGASLRHWRRDCAMVFQQFALVDRLDVLTNVLMGRLDHTPVWRSLLKLWTGDDKAIALSALELFDIGSLAANRAGALSGGQQQRVAIARALVQEPRMILADEPIASLDPRNTQLVMDALLRVNRDFGITVLTNLHSIELAKRYCDRLIGMKAGRIVFDGTPAELTDAAVTELYGLEAADVIEIPSAADPTPDEIRAAWDAARAREPV